VHVAASFIHVVIFQFLLFAKAVGRFHVLSFSLTLWKYCEILSEIRDWRGFGDVDVVLQQQLDRGWWWLVSCCVLCFLSLSLTQTHIMISPGLCPERFFSAKNTLIGMLPCEK
jgi:hypothetical protein